MEKFPSPTITNNRTSLSLFALEDTWLWESAFCDFTKGSDAALILVLDPPIGADFQTKAAALRERTAALFSRPGETFRWPVITWISSGAVVTY